MFGRKIHVKKNEKVLNLRKKLPLVEFHKEAIKGYWRDLTLRKKSLGKAVGFLILIFIVGSFFYTEANVATFYADTCLGGWQNSNNASGKPEVQGADADFTESNSAMLSNSIADIFCSGFKSEASMEDTAVPKKFVLKFSWLVVDSVLNEASPLPSTEVILENGITSPVNEEVPHEESGGTEEGKLEIIEVKDDSDIPSELQSDSVVESESGVLEQTSTPTVSPSEIAPETVSAPEPTPEPVLEPEPTPQSFLDKIFTKVFAQEVVEEVSPAIESSTPTVPVEVVSEPVVENSNEETSIVEVVEPEPSVQEVEPETVSTEVTIQSVEETEEAVSGTSFEEVNVEGTTVQSSSEEINLTPEESPANDFLEIAYTVDGLDWKSLGKVSRANWRSASYEIIDPNIKTWGDLSKLQISVKNLPTIDTTPAVYLDSVYLEVEYDNVEPEKELPVIEITDEEFGAITSNVNDFGSDDAPVFEIEDPNLSLYEIETLLKNGQAEIISDPSGTLTNGLSFPDSAYNIDLSNERDDSKGLIEMLFPTAPTSGENNTPESLTAPTDATGVIVLPLFENENESSKNTNPIDILRDITSYLDTEVALAGIFDADIVKAEVFDSLQQPTDIETTINTVKVNGISKQTVSVEKPGRQFRPGKYTLRVTLLTDYAKIIYKQDFSWGVLSINTNKSIFYPGDDAYLQMGVLDEYGHTICNADLVLVIKSPSGVETTFDTADGSVVRELQCGPDNVIEVPDYYAHFPVPTEIGKYQMTLKATTANGPKTVQDTFDVGTDQPFDVSRTGPTRIYPLPSYPMTMRITSVADWTGTIVERVPASFDIEPPKNSVNYNDVQTVGDEKLIYWNVSLVAGEETTIGYYFNAPNASPDFFLLGPLEFYNSISDPEPIFKETRFWQIANDAFSFRATITIDHTKVSGGESNFPVLISGTYDGTGGEPDLRTTANGGDVTNSSGYDIGFYSDIGLTTKLKWETESYSATTGAVIYWVKFPSLSASVDDVIYMGYGNSSITTDQSDPTNVWDSDFREVYHMKDATTSTVADSDTLANTGTKKAANTPVEFDAKIGKGQSFSGSDYISSFGSSISPVSSRTLEAWINVTDTSRRGIMGTRSAASANGFVFTINRTTAGNITYFHTGGSTIEKAGGINTGTWYHAAVVLNTSTAVAEVFVNGVSKGTQTSFSTETSSAFNGIFGGEKQTDTAPWKGGLDEIRISSAVRNVSWLLTSYNSQNSPSTFYTMGGETALISIAGTANGNNGGTVKVAINGTVQSQTATIASSAWSINNVVQPSANDIITVWVDGVSDANETTGVTKWSSGNVSGMVLNTGVVSVGSNQNTALTVTNMGQYDADNDEDVMHTANSSAILVQGASNSYTDETLSVLASNTLTVDTTESLTSEKLNIAGTLTSVGNATYTLTGTSGTLFTKSGTFTQATSTVNITSASGTPTLLSAGTTFHKLTINSAATVINAGAAITMSSADAANKLYIQAGVLNDGGNTIVGTANGTLEVAASATLCISGTAAGTNATCNSGAVPTTASTFPTNYTNGNITLSATSTVIYLADADMTVSSTPTYGDLRLTPLLVSTSRTYTTGGALTINGIFNITPDESGASTPALTVNPAGNITVASGKVTNINPANSATATLDLRPVATDYDFSTGLLNVAAGGTLDATSAASTITLTGTSGTLFTLAGTFTITSGTPTVVMNPDAAVTLTSGAITFYNLTLSPTITAARIYTFGSTAITINGDFNVNPRALSALALTVNLGADITVATTKTTTITGNVSGTSLVDLRPVATNYNLTTGLLNVAAAGTLDAGGSASVITLTGTSGTLFTRVGTFTQGTSEVKVTSASGTPRFLVGNATFHKLTINSTATVINAGGVITMSNADATNKLYIQAGVLNDGGNNIVGTTNGTLEVAAGAALCLGGTPLGTNATCDSGATYGGASSFPSNYTNGNITLATTSTVYYNQNADENVTISSVPTYGNLYFKPIVTDPADRFVANGALTINGDFTINPSLSSGGDNFYFDAGGNITVASTKTTTITSSAGTDLMYFDLRPALTDYNLSTGFLNIGAKGVLDATSSASTITVADDWTNAGFFTAGSSTVVLNTTATATVGGGPTTFYNLTINTPAKEVNFSTTAAHIIHVTNTFSATGSYGNNIKLYSSSAGTQWNFHPTGTATVDFVETKDGGCESGSVTVSTSHFLNLGNNDSCWTATTMTFSLSANSINLGALTTGATGTGTHTITAITAAPGGVVITYNGPTLTNQSSATIPVYTSSASSPGTAGFGINLKDNATPNVGANPTTNYGTCSINSGYDTADAYTFVAGTTTTIANTNSLPGDCVYTVSYIGNISSITSSGSYSTTVTYIMTGTF